MDNASAHYAIISQQAIDIEIEIFVFELANRFSLKELNYEIRRARLHLFLAEYYAQIANAGYWRFYLECCRQAIQWLRNAPGPAAITTPGRHIDIEAIKTKADIVSVIEGYTELKKSGNRFSGLCPFHSEKQPSFVVYPEQQSWHCFGACNTGGDIFDFIMRAEHTDFRGAAAILGGG